MKHLASLFTLGTLAFLPAITNSVGYYENILGVVPRFENGTIVKDVERSQGKPYLEQIRESHPQLYKQQKQIVEKRVDRNMNAIRAHVRCVATPLICAPHNLIDDLQTGSGN